VSDVLPIVISRKSRVKILCLGAAISSFILDYIARLKNGGSHLKYFIVKQLAVHPPEMYDAPALWQRSEKLEDWVTKRFIELTCTSNELVELADLLGRGEGPFQWSEERRGLLRAELDAAFFHLYGIERHDVDYIMETFPIVKKKDVSAFGSYRTKELILEVYDAMTQAIRTGEPYETILDPPPGQGPRHPDSSRSA
jgi:hypothetical protein